MCTPSRYINISRLCHRQKRSRRDSRWPGNCQTDDVLLQRRCRLNAMGQVMDKFHGRQWRRKQIKVMSDRVFEKVKNQTGRPNLTFEDLYIAVLLIYNDVNKRLPGPHFDPPNKDRIRDILQSCDINLDGEIDKEEFVKFMEIVTADTFVVVSQGLLITLVVAPTVAVATKRATEGVPGIGKLVQKLPIGVYASLVTLAIVMFQNAAPLSD